MVWNHPAWRGFLGALLLVLLLPATASANEKEGTAAISSLSIVLVPERNVFELRNQYKHITDFLANKLGVPVSIQVAATYSQAASLLAEGKVDAAFLGSFSYILARRMALVEPLARPVWLDERSTCRGYIFTRKEDAWKALADLKGRRLILVDNASTTGFLFPAYYFRNFGIHSLEEYFSKIIYSHSHDVAIWAVFRGEADIGAAKDHVFLALAREYPEILERLTVIARSSDLPSNCLSVRADLDPYMKDRIRFLLLQMDKTSEGRKALGQFGALGFVRTEDADFEGLRDLLKEVETNDSRWME